MRFKNYMSVVTAACADRISGPARRQLEDPSAAGEVCARLAKSAAEGVLLSENPAAFARNARFLAVMLCVHFELAHAWGLVDVRDDDDLQADVTDLAGAGLMPHRILRMANILTAGLCPFPNLFRPSAIVERRIASPLGRETGRYVLEFNPVIVKYVPIGTRLVGRWAGNVSSFRVIERRARPGVVLVEHVGLSTDAEPSEGTHMSIRFPGESAPNVYGDVHMLGRWFPAPGAGQFVLYGPPPSWFVGSSVGVCSRLDYVLARLEGRSPGPCFAGRVVGTSDPLDPRVVRVDFGAAVRSGLGPAAAWVAERRIVPARRSGGRPVAMQPVRRRV